MFITLNYYSLFEPLHFLSSIDGQMKKKGVFTIRNSWKRRWRWKPETESDASVEEKKKSKMVFSCLFNKKENEKISK